MKVYLDESGHEADGFVVIAGFLGSEAQWDAFERDWLLHLGATTAFHIRKQRWGKPPTKERLARLATIPYRHGLVPVVGAVKVSDYRDLPANVAETYSTQGYLLPLYPIIIGVVQATPSTERINWIFEEQVQYEAEARNIFRVLAEKLGRARFGTISYVSKADTCLTQPADFLAFAVLQDLRDPTSEKAQWCRPILGSRSYIGKIVDRETIRNIVGVSLPNAALKSEIEMGFNPRQLFSKLKTKAEVRQALEGARKRREQLEKAQSLIDKN